MWTRKSPSLVAEAEGFGSLGQISYSLDLIRFRDPQRVCISIGITGVDQLRHRTILNSGE
jgi:hypothetical protein